MAETIEEALNYVRSYLSECRSMGTKRTLVATMEAILASLDRTVPAEGGEPVKRTMTLNLTEEEMAALEKLAAEKELSLPIIFRHALKVYQLWSLPDSHPARIDWARQCSIAAPSQEPQDARREWYARLIDPEA